jgi:glycosyltransferase involved in cell wall biosynthesis
MFVIGQLGPASHETDWIAKRDNRTSGVCKERRLAADTMRVLLISGSLPPMKCGVGDYTAKLANALNRRDDTSIAVLTDTAASPIPPDFDFEVFPIVDGWRMTNASRIARMVQGWRPDIVHIQYPTQGYGHSYLPWLLPTLFSLANIPIVQTWHEYHMERGRRNLLNAILGGGLIAVRPNYRETMSNWYRWIIRRKRFGFIPSASAIPRIQLSQAERLATRSEFAAAPSRVVVNFGFAYPAKRLEQLFEILDPSHDHLVLICDLNPDDEYHRVILDRVNQKPWSGNVTITGFLPADSVGRILAAADAVVLPFRDGGGIWNTSIHAAITQGAFVLTTSRELRGYDAAANIYYAQPDDVADMQFALRTYGGRSRNATDEGPAFEWEAIAESHRAFYASVSRGSQSR